MASPTTTHVIEIETGIGEPAFIPLAMGQELQPISVGKKGMWRIESPRVLDVHAFVYFDGNSLFLQSADEANAASVDGFRVGKAWTELHAPCKIEIGLARLRFRSLIADEHDATEMAFGPPGGPPAATGPRPPAPPPSNPSAPPIAFPKVDRPFKPGEFSSAPDDGESTRIAPLESSPSRVASASSPRPAAGESGPYLGGTMQVQGPMASMPPMGYGPPQGYDPNQPPQGYDPNQPPQGYDPNQPPQGYDPNQPPYGQQPYPNAGGSGGFGAMGPGGMQGPGMPGAYGSMTPQGVQQAPPAQGSKPKQSSIPKIVAGLLLIIGSIVYLVAEDEPPPPKKKPVATLDAGATTAAGSSSAPLVAPAVMQPPSTPAWPAGVPCPPPNWPPNTPPPCAPNSAGAQVDPPARDSGKPTRDSGPSLPAGTKTLERQAVDFVAAGDTAKAAAAYEELARRDPENKVYPEAARILRAKLAAPH